jgi:hypothetical protein
MRIQKDAESLRTEHGAPASGAGMLPPAGVRVCAIPGSRLQEVWQARQDHLCPIGFSDVGALCVCCFFLGGRVGGVTGRQSVTDRQTDRLVIY